MSDGHDYRSEVDRLRQSRIRGLQAMVDGLSERLAKAWDERDAALTERDDARREQVRDHLAAWHPNLPHTTQNLRYEAKGRWGEPESLRLFPAPTDPEGGGPTE